MNKAISNQSNSGGLITSLDALQNYQDLKEIKENNRMDKAIHRKTLSQFCSDRKFLSKHRYINKPLKITYQTESDIDIDKVLKYIAEIKFDDINNCFLIFKAVSNKLINQFNKSIKSLLKILNKLEGK